MFYLLLFERSITLTTPLWHDYWFPLGREHQPQARLETGRIENLSAPWYDGTDLDLEDDDLSDMIDADNELETQGYDPSLQRRRRPADEQPRGWDEIQSAFAEIFNYCQRPDLTPVTSDRWVPASCVLVMGLPNEDDKEADTPCVWVRPKSRPRSQPLNNRRRN